MSLSVCEADEGIGGKKRENSLSSNTLQDDIALSPEQSWSPGNQLSSADVPVQLENSTITEPHGMQWCVNGFAHFLDPDETHENSSTDTGDDPTSQPQVDNREACSARKRQKTSENPSDALHQCSFCPFQTVNSYSLKTHELHHTTKFPFRCSICSYSANSPARLTSHLNRVHSYINDSNNPPDMLLESDDSSSEDLTTAERSGPSKIDNCVEKRKPTERKSVELVWRKVYHCPLPNCRFWCRSVSNFHDHQMGHRQELAYSCSVCRYEARTRNNMGIHIRTAAKDEAHKTAKCLLTVPIPNDRYADLYRPALIPSTAATGRIPTGFSLSGEASDMTDIPLIEVATVQSVPQPCNVDSNDHSASKCPPAVQESGMKPKNSLLAALLGKEIPLLPSPLPIFPSVNGQPDKDPSTKRLDASAPNDNLGHSGIDADNWLGTSADGLPGEEMECRKQIIQLKEDIRQAQTVMLRLRQETSPLKTKEEFIRAEEVKRKKLEFLEILAGKTRADVAHLVKKKEEFQQRLEELKQRFPGRLGKVEEELNKRILSLDQERNVLLNRLVSVRSEIALFSSDSTAKPESSACVNIPLEEVKTLQRSRILYLARLQEKLARISFQRIFDNIRHNEKQMLDALDEIKTSSQNSPAI